MERCPHPECGYVTDFISKVHCRYVHGMERKELFKKYGDPRKKGPQPFEYSHNQKHRMLYDYGYYINTGGENDGYKSW